MSQQPSDGASNHSAGEKADRGAKKTRGNGTSGRSSYRKAGVKKGQRGRSGNSKYRDSGRKGRSAAYGRDDDRVRHDRSNPHRQGFREDRMAQKLAEPDVSPDLDTTVLDPSILQDLRVLAQGNATRVAQHLVMAVDLLEDDPKLALEHARAAKNRAGRVGVVRETNGIVAYHAGEWREALAELRAARRISGGPGLLSVMADAERGLGRPEKALEIGRGPEVHQLDREGRIELGIVLAGARRDLGQFDSAVATLERLAPNKNATDVTAMRLAYAYADALAQVGRVDEALEWFKHVSTIDTERLTDARERVEELAKD